MNSGECCASLGSCAVVTDNESPFSELWPVLLPQAVIQIASIAIFDTRGVMLGAATPASMLAELNTANYYGNYYIVSVVLADGSRHNYKLLRK